MNQNCTIREIISEERPYEKCEQYGAGNLTDVELLAILLRTGTKEDMRHRTQEHMKLLMLNTKAKLLGETTISKGTVNASLLTPRELFIEALQKNAVSIILLHNHPSGDPTPSREDLLITKRIKEAGSLIGIELLDHIIIGNNCYISFAEQELI